MLLCMLYVHLVGLVKENNLINMHGVNNFKILYLNMCWKHTFLSMVCHVIHMRSR